MDADGGVDLAMCQQQRRRAVGPHQLEAKGVAESHEQAGLQRRQQALEQHPAGPEGQGAAGGVGKKSGMCYQWQT